MAWQDRLLPASFRGIPFFVDSHELTGGRHAVSHEPPNRNSNFAEDLGRKGKIYKINAHILGDNYFFIRNGLIDAMEKRGSGVLVHPYLGIKNVQPESYTVTEDSLVGRVVSFTLTFIDAGEQSFPFAAIDAIGSFLTTAATAIARIKNAYQLAFSLANQPAFVLEDFLNQVDDAIDTYFTAKKKVRSLTEQSASLEKTINDFKNNKQTAATNPAVMAQTTDDIILGFKELVPDPPDDFTIDLTGGRDDKIVVFNDFLNFGSDNENLPENTPSERQIKTNALAFSDLIQQLAIVRLAEQVVTKEFRTIEEAISTRNTVSESIERHLKANRIDDDLFQSLEDVNAKMVAAVPNENTTFASEKELDLKAEIPSIILSYDLFESDEQELDIIRRNKIREPGFISGKVKVITGG